MTYISNVFPHLAPIFFQISRNSHFSHTLKGRHSHMFCAGQWNEWKVHVSVSGWLPVLHFSVLLYSSLVTKMPCVSNGADIRCVHQPRSVSEWSRDPSPQTQACPVTWVANSIYCFRMTELFALFVITEKPLPFWLVQALSLFSIVIILAFELMIFRGMRVQIFYLVLYTEEKPIIF